MTNKELKNFVIDFLKTKQPKSFKGPTYIETQKQVLERTKFIDENVKNRDITWAERFYCILNDMYDLPYCKVCGKQIQMFYGLERPNRKSGYAKSCSMSCAARNPDTQKKKEQTYLVKYGEKAVNPGQLTVVKKRIEETCLKRFGFRSHNSSPEIKETKKKVILEKYGVGSILEIQEAKRKGMLAKYGVDHPMHCKEIKDRLRKTNLKRYGHHVCFHGNILKSRIMTKIRKNTADKRFEYLKHKFIVPLFTKEDYIDNPLNKIWNFKCEKCGKAFTLSLTDISHAYCDTCTNFSSNKEQSLYIWLISLNQNVKKHNSSILHGKSIDFVLEDFKFAIEFDGLFWHRVENEKALRWKSENVTEKNVAIWKTQQAKKAGYTLMHIFEHEWDYKQEVIKDIIKRQLKIKLDYEIDSTVCKIKPISFETLKIFVKENSINWKVKSPQTKLGMFYNDELVATFGVNFTRSGISEISSYYQKIGYSTYNCLKSFIDFYLADHKYIEQLAYYGNLRFPFFEEFYQLNFTTEEIFSPNRWYFSKSSEHKDEIKNNGLLSAQFCKKSMLKNTLTNFDENKTEIENMHANGFMRVYDCGKEKMILDLSNY